MSELGQRNPHLVYGEQVGRQLGRLPERSRRAFELGCLERQVVVYQKVSRLCRAEHRLDVPGIVSDLWAWLLDSAPVPSAHVPALLAEASEGPDFYAFRHDVLLNLLSVTDRAVSGSAAGGLPSETAERNVAVIIGFLAVAYDVADRGVEVSPEVLNHPLRLREVVRQQEDIGLLDGREYTADLGRLMRSRSVGYDLFDGGWFPADKLPARS